MGGCIWSEEDKIRLNLNYIMCKHCLVLLSPSVICHVVGITYQTIERRLLAEMLGDPLGKNWTQ